MASASMLFGKAKVTVDGQEVLVSERSKLTLAGVERHVVKGPRVYGFAEEVMAAMVETSYYIDASTDLDLINSWADVTVMFECDTGQIYVLPHAWSVTPPAAESATQGGTAPLKFNAKTSERVS